MFVMTPKRWDLSLIPRSVKPELNGQLSKRQFLHFGLKPQTFLEFFIFGIRQVQVYNSANRVKRIFLNLKAICL